MRGDDRPLSGAGRWSARHERRTHNTSPHDRRVITMFRTVRRLGAQAALILAIGSAVLLSRGGREAVAVPLRPALDPAPITAPLARPSLPVPAPGVRVVLALPWTNGSAELASEVLAARYGADLSDSR